MRGVAARTEAEVGASGYGVGLTAQSMQRVGCGQLGRRNSSCALDPLRGLVSNTCRNGWGRQKIPTRGRRVGS